MRRLQRSTSLFCLVLGLVVTAPLLPLPGVAQSVEQNQTSEIDRAILEGDQLFNEGSAESLRKAIVAFEKALQLSRTATASAKQARASHALGKIYSNLGEQQKALEYYDQALLLFRTVGDWGKEAVTLNNIGSVYSSLGQKQEALKYYDQALPIRRAVGDRSGEAATLSNIGSVYDDLGQRQEALKYYNQALPLFRAVGNRSGEAATLNNIGSVYDALGQKQEALKYYDQALPIRRAVEDRSGEATTLSNIGFIYSSLGQKQEALKYYNQALLLSRAVGDRSGEATTLSNIGSIYSSLGQKQEALKYYNQALLLSRAVEDRSGEATTLSNIGFIYSSLGQKQEALKYYNQALLLSRAVGDRDGEATTLNNIGSVYDDLGQRQEALKYYNQALLLSRAVGDRDGEATTLSNIGSIYSSLGQKQESLRYYNQALPLRRAVGNRSGEAITLNNIGVIYFDLGQKQEASRYYNQALPLYRAVGDRSGEAITLNNIAFAFANQKHPELAIAIYKQSVNVYESIRQDNQQLPKELRESYTKSISYTYQNLADLLIKQGRLPEAQAVLELLKIKELNTYTRDARTPSSGISFTPAEIKALDEIFRPYATAAEFARQLSECAEKNCPNLDQLKRQRDRINDEITAILDRLRTTLKNQVIDISKLNTQQYTDAAEKIVNAQPGTVLIYPVITETKTQFLLAFKAGASDQAPVTFRAIDGANIGSDTLFQTANDLRNALADPTSDLKTLQTTSQKLYTWLIKPLEPEISHPSIKHLVFVGDRATRHIPFAALYDGKEYLINKYTLTTVLAASTTRDPSEPQPKAPNVLAVGATEFKGASPLPYVKPEILSIVQTPENKQGIFPGLSYLNDQFSFERLRDSLKGHNILHIATHGNLDPVNIDKSYLLTSSGEQITKSEIQRLRDYGLKGVHMVILSACDTGTGGKNSDNLEIAGISHYFMEGGAKSVIASLWKVNDPATALFMQEFYKHLKAGMTKAQAIRQVQQDFINGKLTAQDAPTRSIAVVAKKTSDRPTSINFAHPYYWSPFILIGNNL